MLEEGLRSPTFSPAEAAQGLLSFVRFELQDGGANAEKRFIGLFSLMCERLYGSIDQKDFRHQTGGWLSRQSRWDIPRTPSTQRGMSHHSHSSQAPSIEADPVVQLLCGIESLTSKEKLPTFIEAISGNTEARRGVRIQYPFYALPKPTQDFVLKMLQSCVDASVVDDSTRSNTFRLFGGLIRIPPRDQTELRRMHQTNKTQKMDRSRPLALSPGGASSLLLSSSNSSSRSLFDDKRKKKTPSTPQIMLNMVEYFLFTFFRYPLASPAPTTPAPQGHHQRPIGVTRHRSSTPYGESIYLHLFRCYLVHYLPAHHQIKAFLGFPNLSTENELFLRILIELWLCNGVDMMPMKKSVELLLERRKKNGNVKEEVDLESIFDLVKVKYDPPPPIVQKCVRSLIAHAVKDPNVAPAIMDCGENAKKKGGGDTMALPWCISPSMTVLQQAFYNYVIASFRHAPIHVTGSPFYAALDSWLLWLEPWNVEKRKKQAGGSVLASTVSHISHSTQKPQPTTQILKIMKPIARSKYSRQWEPFVAANLHLYTGPLALFLRRARELDFSSQYFSRSFALLQRVFRVYSPDLMHTINSLLAGQHSMASLVETHEKCMGAYAPTGSTHMASLQSDMRNLLEEVDMQYRKTVRERGFLDRIEANIESVFSFVGLTQTSAGQERQIHQLLEKARLIASLPADYQIVPSDDAGAGATQGSRSRSLQGESSEQAMKINGILTDYGREQLLSGEVTYDPNDVLYIGERMTSSPKSHELAWLVPLSIRASGYLNSKLGLVGEKDTKISSVRINLRFLADYRNIMFLLITVWLWIRFLL